MKAHHIELVFGIFTVSKNGRENWFQSVIHTAYA